MSGRRGDRLLAVLRVRRVQEAQARVLALAVAAEAEDSAARSRHEDAQLARATEPDGLAAAWSGTRAGLLARATQAVALERAALEAGRRSDDARAEWLVRHERVALLERLAEAHRTSTVRAIASARQAASDDITSSRSGREQHS